MFPTCKSKKIEVIRFKNLNINSHVKYKQVYNSITIFYTLFQIY